MINSKSGLSLPAFHLPGWLKWVSSPVFLLFLISFFGMILRGYHLGQWSFWLDEYYTVSAIFNPPEHIPPRITNILIGWMLNSFGVSEWNARLIPAIFGVVTIPAIYFVTKSLFNNKNTSLLAALLLSVSIWHIYWSQNARFYTMLVLFFMLALTFFYLGAERNNAIYFIGASLFITLSIWEHATAGLLIVIVICYIAASSILWFTRPSGLNFQNTIVFIVSLIIFSIPLLFFTLPAFIAQSEAAQLNTSNNNPIWILMGIGYYVELPIICTAILGAAYLLLKRQRAGLILSLWAFVPMVVLVMLTFFTYTANRYAFITLPAWIILASFVSTELYSQKQGPLSGLLALSLPLLLVVSSFGEVALYHQYQNGNRDNWKGAIEYIKTQAQIDDLVVATKPEIAAFYLQKNVMSFDEWSDIHQDLGNQRVWFVEDMNINQVNPEHIEWVQTHAQQVAVLDNIVRGRNFRMRILVYDPKFPSIYSNP